MAVQGSNTALVNTPLSAIAAFVDHAVCDSGDLADVLELLNEGHPAHHGRPADEVHRIRGYVLAALGRTTLPDAAVLHVLGELQNGHHGYLVAAAAFAVRAGRPLALFTPYLMAAARNALHNDGRFDLTRLEAYHPLERYTTPLTEVFHSLAWLGAMAQDALPALRGLRTSEGLMCPMAAAALHQALDAVAGSRTTHIERTDASFTATCCGAPLTARVNTPQLQDVTMQDQDGNTLRFDPFLRGRPTVLAFFYTRCNNPNKCSLTVSRLAQLHERMVREGIGERCNLAVFTYDPDHDLPDRLRSYGVRRSFQFTPTARFMRTQGDGLSTLRTMLTLGVSYSGAVVQSHRIELFVLDQTLQVRASFTSVQWDENEVLRMLHGLVDTPPHGPPGRRPVAGNILARAGSLLSSLGLIAFPKCPLCLAAYFSAFGLIGSSTQGPSPLFFPLLFALMAINLFLMWRVARRTGWYWPLHAGLLGVACLILGRLLAVDPLWWAGVPVLMAASVMHAMPVSAQQRVKSWFRHWCAGQAVSGS